MDDYIKYICAMTGKNPIILVGCDVFLDYSGSKIRRK